jgi:hypothetical protein
MVEEHSRGCHYLGSKSDQLGLCCFHWGWSQVRYGCSLQVHFPYCYCSQLHHDAVITARLADFKYKLLCELLHNTSQARGTAAGC